MLIAALLATTLAASPPKTPQDLAHPTIAPATASSETETVAEGEDEPICITHAQLGTRFKKKTCYTKVEYERRQLEERQALQRIQRIPLKGN